VAVMNSASTSSCSGRRTRLLSFIWQCGGAVLWGIFFSVAPLVLVVGSSIVWLPILIWRETVRSRQHAFWPGLLARFAIVTVIVAGAIRTPKYDDELVGPIAFKDISLRNLCQKLNEEYGVRVRTFEDSADALTLSFSTTKPMSRRAVVEVLAKQVDYTSSFAGCGTDATLLTGTWGTYYLYKKRSSSESDEMQ
jgi:hypothetical protein